MELPEMNLNSIKKEAGKLKGKRVVLRAGLNVPIKDGNIVDGSRILKVLPTVEFLKNEGAKIIIISHIGREKDDSLKIVSDEMNKHTSVKFYPKIKDDGLRGVVSEMHEGEIIMLENLRSEAGETENDIEFAQYLASLGDIYVNDAFAVAHRSHASIVSLPALLPPYVGVQFEEELKHLTLAFNPPRPFLFILGGAKFKTKIPLIKKFLDIADTVFVGGALSNNFFKEKGLEIGKSMYDDGDFNLGELLNNEKLIMPCDVIVKNRDDISEKSVNEIDPDDAVWDCGHLTVEDLKRRVQESGFVLWNGPTGDYLQGFDKSTKELLSAIAESDTTSIIGGGDTLTLISETGLEDKFTFVSTGGGAMLDFLADGKLVGIDAIENSQK